MIKKYDVIEDSYQSFRLAQGLTFEELNNWLASKGKTIVNERAIGLFYVEVTVNR